MSTRRWALALLLIAGCTGQSSAKPTTTPTPIPRITTYPYPDQAGHISPLPVPDAFPGELARKDNNLNPGIRTATLVVTVPAGKVVATDVLCQGRGKVVVTSRPTSGAEQTLSCDSKQIPSQLGVFASNQEKTPTRYVFSLRTTGPSRWLIAVSARAPQ